jgi:hypothetical protein
MINDLWRQLHLPQRYCVQNKKEVMHDDMVVELVRYAKSDERTLGGEHISFILNKKEGLQGLMVMDASLQCGTLPTEDEAKQIACEFISWYAADLIDDLELKWIAEHEEVIQVDDKDLIITGMKVKCRIKSTGKFAWVIVGKNRQAITFERDIIWNYNMSERVTEKWLHDCWVKIR